jgi:hypothetical protein
MHYDPEQELPKAVDAAHRILLAVHYNQPMFLEDLQAMIFPLIVMWQGYAASGEGGSMFPPLIDPIIEKLVKASLLPEGDQRRSAYNPTMPEIFAIAEYCNTEVREFLRRAGWG